MKGPVAQMERSLSRWCTDRESWAGSTRRMRRNGGINRKEFVKVAHRLRILDRKYKETSEDAQKWWHKSNGVCQGGASIANLGQEVQGNLRGCAETVA